MSRAIKVCDLFFGDSIRSDNGSQVGLPIFGRFAAIVRRQELRVFEAGSEWCVLLPWGSTLAGGWTRDEALDHACDNIQGKGGVDGWVTDESVARVSAIESAKARHNEKAAASVSYAKKFGAAV